MNKTNKYPNTKKYAGEVIKSLSVVVENNKEVPEEIIEKKSIESFNKNINKGIVINCGFLNVREKPNSRSVVLRRIPVGTEVEILGEDGDFYKILNGFVMKDFIKT